MSGVPKNLQIGEIGMIQINNKFNVGQEVYLIGMRCRTHNNKKKFKWVVKTKKDKPSKILCMFYKHKLYGEDELLYHIENHDKVREERLFTDYEAALQECNRRNEEDKNAGFAVE